MNPLISSNKTEQPQNPTIWVVDDDSAIRWVLEKALKKAGFNCFIFEHAKKVIDKLTKDCTVDLIITDIKMPDIDGLTLLNHIKKYKPNLPVIVMTAHSDLDAAVSAYEQGAFDYLPKPFDINEVISLINNAINQNKNQTDSAEEQAPSSTGLIGEAPAMQEVFKIIGRLSKSSMSVLINGESGTGKELIAKALHTHSPRANATFIALNMAAIPKDLIEAELFGYEKGAFTGATQMRQGRFEQANNGTLFLDEIGDMPLEVQTRLLRVLSDGQFYRIGGYNPIKVDVRIIAATHQNLEQKVEQNEFREDLFHRLNVIKIRIPPLRERTSDIPALSEHFLLLAAKELGVEKKQLTKEAIDALCKLNWPGNVRQLENTCRWLTVMSSNQDLRKTDLPKELLEQIDQRLQSNKSEESELNEFDHLWQAQLDSWIKKEMTTKKEHLLDDVSESVERILLSNALEFTKGHKQEAAKILGWGRNTLARKMKELNIYFNLVNND